MSDAVTGKTGKVLIEGTGEILEIRNWTMDRNLDTPETSSMSSNGWREFKAGMKGWSGSFETIKFVDLHGTEAVGSFYVGAAASGSEPIFSGTVNITNAPANVPFDDTVAYAHTFQGSGPLTVATS